MSIKVLAVIKIYRVRGRARGREIEAEVEVISFRFDLNNNQSLALWVGQHPLLALELFSQTNGELRYVWAVLSLSLPQDVVM